MAINWQQVIATLVATVGGGGVVLAALAWLIKQVVTSRLVRETEEFKIRLKADADRETEALRAQLRGAADTEIERTKAILHNASRVHERQLDVLTKIYKHLWEANESFQSLVSGNRMPNGPDEKEFHEWTLKALRGARTELLNSRLLVPQPLAEKCDEFLKKVLMGRFLYLQAHDSTISNNPEVWVTFSEGAYKSAFETVPSILNDIENAARDIIHGKVPGSNSGATKVAR